MVSTNARPTTPSTRNERLEQRIQEHRVEVARWREQNGDPAEALDRFIRERFDIRALIPDDSHIGEGGTFWWEDDDSDAG
jgi:hypothetical protein